jgi:hypothetical protein
MFPVIVLQSRNQSVYRLDNQIVLLYLKKRDSEQPFFVMWVDNAELMRAF